MKIVKIWFDDEHIFGVDENGKEYSQSLLWYPKLRTATAEQREQYKFGLGGIHWRELDEDISFESFEYDDAEPTAMQRFFLTHKDQWIQETISRKRKSHPRPYTQTWQRNDGCLLLNE